MKHIIEWKENFYNQIDGTWQKYDNIDFNLELASYQITRFARLYPLLVDANELLAVRINNKCHYRCPHCFIGANRGAVPLEEVPYERVISSIEKNKRAFVLFSGGDPVFHKDFKRMLEHCKNNNIVTIMESSLPGFGDPEKAKEYSNLLDMVIIPMYSHDREVYESVSQLKGSYDYIFKAIDNVQNFMPNTSINFVTIVTRQIMKTLYETIEFLHENYKKSPLFIGASCFEGPSYSKQISPSFTEISETYKKVLRDFGDRCITLYTPICFLFPYHNRPQFDELEGINQEGLDIVDGIAEDVVYNQHECRGLVERCKECNLNYMCDGPLNAYKEIYDAENEVIPIKDKDFLKSEYGNCEKCGKKFNGKKVTIETKFSTENNGEIVYEQNRFLRREFCLECRDIIYNKLKDIN